jgi:AcrR family transcriptional regulator
MVAIGVMPNIRTNAVAGPRSRRKPADNTRERILAAAAEEFATKGLAGARVDGIAAAADCNKAMLYYFFTSKEGLYVEVLEESYAHMRESERGLDLAHLPPLKAITRLVEFKFDYYNKHPILIKLLSGENLNQATFLRQSKRLRGMQSPLLETLTTVLKAGEAEGSMRQDIDPVELYISIAGLAYFYFANAPTLSIAFGRDILGNASKNRRRQHAVDVILGYVTTLR